MDNFEKKPNKNNKIYKDSFGGEVGNI